MLCLILLVVLQSSQTDFAAEAFGLEMYDYTLTIVTASAIPVAIFLIGIYPELMEKLEKKLLTISEQYLQSLYVYC